GPVRAIALDVGSKTIGVAVSDADGVIARAHAVLPRAGQQADAVRVCELIAEFEAAAVVVGLPLELDGSEGHRARLVQRFVTVLEQAIAERGLTIELARWDERFSTAAAEGPCSRLISPAPSGARPSTQSRPRSSCRVGSTRGRRR